MNPTLKTSTALVPPDSITIPLSQFKADPQKVHDDRNVTTLIAGIGLAAIGGFATHALVKSRPNSAVITATAALLGGIGGALLGHSLKTQEEARSDALMAAAASSNFGAHIKREMSQRETGAFVAGAIVGLPFVW